MIKNTLKFSQQQEENIFWVTMTDLLLGLAIIFITLFVLAMTGFTQAKMESQKLKEDVSEHLNKQLKSQNLNVHLDKMTGKVEISDLELFETGSYKLSSKGKAYLDKFVPVYINTIFSDPKLSDRILNIVIQGHTDSQSFSGVNSKDLQFIKNMELSLSRANAVAEYIFQTNYNKKYNDKLHKMLTVEGKSYTEPILTKNGKEDFTRSRRVELELVIKDSNMNDFVGIK